MKQNNKNVPHLNQQLDSKVGTESSTMYVHLTYVPNTNSNEKSLNNNNKKKTIKYESYYSIVLHSVTPICYDRLSTRPATGW